MVEIISSLYEMEGADQTGAQQRAEEIFSILDRDGDGELEEEEFVTGCLRDMNLMILLNTGKIDITETC